MFCPKCGKECPDNARFCDNCGADLTASNQNPNSGSNSSSAYNAPPYNVNPTIYCRNCGAAISPNAAVCVRCGVPVGLGNTYCPNCGVVTNPNAAVCVRCGAALHKPVDESQQKSKVAAGLFGLFLGTLGIHNFYLGYTKKALAQLLISVLSVGILAPAIAIWALIESIMIFTGSINKDAKGNPLKE